MDETHNIGWAIEHLLDGIEVRRAGWNGKGMWLAYVGPDEWVVRRIGHSAAKWPTLAWIGMKTADNKFVPWLCSQSDLLATDWEVVGPNDRFV